MKKGFTLIELLVVVAIIGVLASVVLASLNSARAKGTEAAIKSNLKNMIPQAELAYDTPGNYSTACAGVAGMMTAITNAGGTAVCYTYDNTRWGVSVKLNSDSTKNWAVDVNGVVTWDTSDAGSGKSWVTGSSACASLGERLASLEELKALREAYGGAPYSFTINGYLSNTVDPANSANAYVVQISNGLIYSVDKTIASYYAHCVH